MYHVPITFYEKRLKGITMKHLQIGEDAPSFPSVLGWILVGALGVGLPALSIAFTYSFLIHIPKIGTLIQQTGHPLLALLPGAILAIGFILAGTTFARIGSGQKLFTKWLTVLGTAGIVATIIALWFQVLILRQYFTVKQVNFDSAKWQNSGCGTSRARQMMLTAMVQQIRGMTPQQVTALLGQSDVGEASYCLGPEPDAFPTNRLVLRVLYDAHGKAADVRISSN